MNLKRTIIIICIFVILIFIINNTVNAAGIVDTAKNWIETGEREDSRFNTEIATEGFESMAGLIWGIGIFVIIGSGIVLGMRFIFASAETKSQISQMLVPYLIGTIIIIGALGIWQFCIKVLDI